MLDGSRCNTNYRPPDCKLGRSMMKIRMPISIFFSVLITMVLTVCPDATKAKLNASDCVANDNFGYSVSIPDKERRLCKNFTLI